MQIKSLFSNRVNWDATKDSVYLKAKNAKTYHDFIISSPSCTGYRNSTEGFLFMNNQGYLLLTVNLIADAKKQIFTKMHVEPNSIIKSADKS